jgi:SEC-C motif/Protein of unknown function (DUF2384)
MPNQAATTSGLGGFWPRRDVPGVPSSWSSSALHDNLSTMRSHSIQKTGRNDPCPCGSGKKYKHCCLASGSTPTVAPETPWSRQRDASDRVTRDLLKLVQRDFADSLLGAWAEFNQTDFPVPMEDLPHEVSLFSPYLIFEWDPDRPPRRSGDKPKAGIVARTYMQKNANRLSELELLVLEQAITRPISFYEVVRTDPGQSVVLRDLLIGEETEVEEHSASTMMRPGDLTYGQIWILPEVATLGRLAATPIPPGKKIEIVGLRQQLRRKIAKQSRELSVADLIRYTEEIRTVYLDIRDGIRRPPTLQNTDGDPLLYHTLTFQVGSAQVAFDALAPLAAGTDMTKEDLLDGAELNADGFLQSVAFDWSKKGNKMHKTWENTILGNLKISGRTLVVEVNSANRAKKVREEIEQRLGLHAKHLSTTSESPEEMIAKSKREKRNRAAQEEEEAIPLLDPEIMKEFNEQMQRETEAWIHRKIPALGGRTPLQAVEDPDGREIVEAMLLDWDRQNEMPAAPGTFRPDIDAVRRLLNLSVTIGTVIR